MSTRPHPNRWPVIRPLYAFAFTAIVVLVLWRSWPQTEPLLSQPGLRVTRVAASPPGTSLSAEELAQLLHLQLRNFKIECDPDRKLVGRLELREKDKPSRKLLEFEGLSLPHNGPEDVILSIILQPLGDSFTQSKKLQCHARLPGITTAQTIDNPFKNAISHGYAMPLDISYPPPTEPSDIYLMDAMVQPPPHAGRKPNEGIRKLRLFLVLNTVPKTS